MYGQTGSGKTYSMIGAHNYDEGVVREEDSDNYDESQF
jgi:hypothetical protein